MSAPPEPIRRILVALDASEASIAALEGAAMLAAHLRAELLGLFVEDENLLRLAGLPFAVEQGTLFSRTQPLGPEQMEQRLRAQAVRAEQSLSVAAARYSCRCEFRVVRGQVEGELLAAMQDTDLAALGSVGVQVVNRSRLGRTARTAIDRAARPLLLLPPGGAVRGPVTVVYDASPLASRALELAVPLAQQLSGEGAQALLVLVTAENPPAANALAQAARVHLERAGTRYRILMTEGRQPEPLIAAVRRERSGTVVLAGDAGPFRSELTRRLLEEVGCAVLLAGNVS